MNECSLTIMTPLPCPNRRAALKTLLLAGIISRSPGGAADLPAELTARQLMDQVLAARQTTGFSARGRMVITKAGQPGKTVQFLLKGRHTAAGSDFLYLALYPAAEKGRAVVVHRDKAGALTGFLREPDGKTTTLNAPLRRQPLFGSDLTVEDLTADFWHWPAPEFQGAEKVCRRDCRIIETRDPKPDKNGPALVRLWISPETSLPLRIEFWSTANEMLRRTECTNVVKSGGRYNMEELTIESPAAGQRTALDFSKGARDLTIPAEEFTPAGVTNLLQEK